MKTPHERQNIRVEVVAISSRAGGVSVAANLAYAALPPGAHAESTDGTPISPAQAVQEMMPTRNLGKTGFRVGIFGLGGQGALEKANNETVAVPVIEKALELGVNYFDTSAIYGGPERWSEHYLGQALKGRRDQVFIARDQGAYPRCRSQESRGILETPEHRSSRYLATS